MLLAQLPVTADLAGHDRPQLETLCCLSALAVVWLHESKTAQLKQKPRLKHVTLSPESPLSQLEAL